MIRTIPLRKLVASPRNVRPRSDAQADLELKADIAARGLLQNLVVSEVRKPRGYYAVEAGERRRRALLSLAEDGALPADFEVACLVLGSAADAREASLAENFQRLAMNPADECLAFEQLIGEGADVEGIARRFGLTQRFVEGRLRLAGLATVVFEALGAGEISLDVAKAYAATPDRERQAWVFEQLAGGYSAQHPDSVRRLMTHATVSGNDPRAMLIGEEAYLAAGGRIEHDLFSDEDAARWLDVALLERLASERMAALAAEAEAETGLAFVRPLLRSWVGYDALEGLTRVEVERPPLSDEERASIEALQAEIDGLAKVIDDENAEDGARDAAEARIGALVGEIEAVADKRPVLDDELKARLGTFLVLGDQGRPRLDAGYYSRAEAEAPTPVEADDRPACGARAASATKPTGLPQRLVDELAMQRRDVLAAHIADDPVLARDLATFVMIDREAGRWSEARGFSLRALPASDPVTGFAAPEAPASLARERGREALDRSWTAPETRAARFDAFRALADEARAAWLAHAVASTLEASLNLAGTRACPFHDHLGRLLAIDVARWWRPTGANYFDRVPKSLALAALAEAGGEALAARYAKAKKVELAQACERLFAGALPVETEVKAAALAWVPEPMRFAPGPEDVGTAAPEAQSGEGVVPLTGTCEDERSSARLEEAA